MDPQDPVAVMIICTSYVYLYLKKGAVVVVIVWWLDLQLPVQSMPITINVVSSNPAQVRCKYKLCDKVCQ